MVNEENLPVQGSRQTFIAPSLLPGRSYEYTFKATCVRNGKTQSVVKTVQARAGEETPVNLEVREELTPPRMLGTSKAALNVKIPAGAQLTVNNKPVRVDGETYTVEALGLGPSQRYSYELQVGITTTDEYITVVRTVDVRAGDDLHIDMRLPTEIARGGPRSVRPEARDLVARERAQTP
jgi:uncharacterized protein (TIGR03000 family)